MFVFAHLVRTRQNKSPPSDRHGNLHADTGGVVVKFIEVEVDRATATMKAALSMVARWLQGHHETLYPKDYEDVQEILRQAKDNATPVRAFGGSYPFTPLPADVVVDLRYIDRLLGLDIYQQTVTVEGGMKLSVLCRILETVSLGLDIFGRVADLTVIDAIAVGAFGANAVLMHSISSVEVALASGKIVTWSWERSAEELRALCCGLGMTAVVLTVTFKCIPLQRFTEISYLCSIRDVLGQWGIQLKSSYCQQLLWFPFSELTVMTHLNPTEKYSMSKQPVLNYFLERLGDVCSRALRRLSLLTSQSLPPLLCSILSRVQFFAQWGVAKNRSDFVHSLPRMWAPQESCRGTSWLVPAEKVPEVLCCVSQWTHANQRTCVAPIFVQTIKLERKPGRKPPFLSPFKDDLSCSVWYDWFVQEVDPDPIALADFEDIFHSVGGVRAWSGERLTSPLVLSDTFDRNYGHWCRNKSRYDPNELLQSCYIQGTVYAAGSGGIRSTSTLSLCSSVVTDYDERM